jgi:hypothetical protein
MERVRKRHEIAGADPLDPHQCRRPRVIENLRHREWRKTMAWTLIEQFYLFGAVAVFVTLAGLIVYADRQTRLR